MRNGPGATPLPITFLGLTIATTLYAAYETQILPKADFHAVGWLVLAVPVPMQLVPAVWGLIRGELAAATGSSVLGATWLALALATITGIPGAPGPSKAEGMLLFASAAALVVSVSTSAVERKLLPALVLLAAAGRFSLTGAAAFTHRESWVNAAGVAGFVLAAIAFSGAFAIELRSALTADRVEVPHLAALRMRTRVGVTAGWRAALLVRPVRNLVLARRLDAHQRLGDLVDRLEPSLGQSPEHCDLVPARALVERVPHERRPLVGQRHALQQHLQLGDLGKLHGSWIPRFAARQTGTSL